MKRLKDIPTVELRNSILLLGMYILMCVISALQILNVNAGLCTMRDARWQFLHAVILLTVLTIMYVNFPKSKYLFGYTASLGFLLLYANILVTLDSAGVYVYMFPLLSLLLIYDNTVMLGTTSLCSVVITVLVFISKDVSEISYTTTNEISCITLLVLTTIFLLTSRVGFIKQYNRIAKLEKELLTDTLTGCNNRKYLQQLIEDGVLDNKDIAVIIGDINDFKGINDTYGHIQGDIALVCVGKVLRDVCCKYSNTHTIRLGGDEFLIITDKVNTTEIIKSFNDMCDVEEELHKLTFDIVISFGYAINETGKMSWQQLYEIADQNMYTIKEESKR